MSTLESNLVVLDWFMRTPRLIDVACDGPRAPAAVRVIAAADDGAAFALERRLAERVPWESGNWHPGGEHELQILEALAELDHEAERTKEPELQFLRDDAESVDHDAPGAAVVEPEPATLDPSPSATPQQVLSLTSEIEALRIELAAAIEAGRTAEASLEEIVRERDVLREHREDLLKQLGGVRQRRRDLEAELASARDELASLEGRMAAAQAAELTGDRVDQLARAAAAIAEREAPSAEDQLIAERLVGALPEDPRVLQALGIVLSRRGRHEAATELLTGVPRSQLSRRASLALLRSSLAVGAVPDEIGPLIASVRPSAEDVRSIAALTEGLASGRIVELTELLLTGVPDEEMTGWLSTVADRLTGRPLATVLGLWASIEPDRALHVMVRALNTERLTTNEPAVATLALDLDWLTLESDDARDLAERLAASLTRRGDVPGLYRVLQRADRLAPHDRHRIGTEIIHAIAQMVPDQEPITAAIETGVRYVEDHRQANRLTDAHRLAGFVRQNLHRTDAETRTLADLVLGDLDRAMKNTATAQRIAEELERDALVDVSRAVSGKRFLFVGGQRQDWYDPLRQELGFSGDSEWRESNRAEPPSMHQLKDIVKAGKLDGVFLFTEFLSHKTSGIKETARQYEVPCIETKMSRPGVIDGLRAWMRGQSANEV